MGDRDARATVTLIREHLLASGAWGLVCLAAGLLVNALLLWPSLQSGHTWLSYGRVRAVHTNVPLYGWFWPVFLATLLYGLPRWFGYALWKPHVARIGLWLWNGVLALGVALVLHGWQQPREYGELPLVVDVLLGLTFYLPALSLGVPLLRRGKALGPLGGGVLCLLVCLPPLIVLGNPPFTDRFDAQATGYEGQNILGYCLGGFIIAVTFLALHPESRAALIRRKQVWLCAIVPVAAFSVGVAWDLTAGSVPYSVQSVVLATSVLFLVPMVVAVWPLRTAGEDPADQAPRLAFVLATATYLLAGIEGCAQFAGGLRSIAQFTAWMPGHAHLAMACAMMLYVLGATFFLIARTHWMNPARYSWGRGYVWLWTGGMVALSGLLTWAGWREGVAIVGEHAHELDAWVGQRSVWLAVLTIGSVLTAGFLRQLVWMWSAYPREAMLEAADRSLAPQVPPGRPGLGQFVGAAGTCAFLVIVGFNLFATPQAAHGFADKDGKAAAALVAQGKSVYVGEGCVSCHTMQVRGADDTFRFGRPSAIVEYQRDLPHQLGTRRIGPDLLRIGGKYSDAWHMTHLANPQALFPDSPMPSYAFLSIRERAALVAYLQSLNPDYAWPRPDPVAQPRETGGWTAYADFCARCHGLDGRGQGPLAVEERFDARDFTSARLMWSRRDVDLERAIRDGIPGTKMAAWPTLTEAQVRELVDTLRAFCPKTPA